MVITYQSLDQACEIWYREIGHKHISFVCFWRDSPPSGPGPSHSSGF